MRCRATLIAEYSSTDGVVEGPRNYVAWLPQQRVLFRGCFLKSVTSDDLGNLADANASCSRSRVRSGVRSPDGAAGRFARVEGELLDHASGVVLTVAWLSHS